MPKVTIAELQTKLDKANRIIDEQQQQISNIHKQYSDLVSRQEYDTLLKQYNNLQERYNILQSLYNKKQSKKHNERGAGRKPKVEDIEIIFRLKGEGLKNKEIAEKAQVSIRTVQRILNGSIVKNDKINNDTDEEDQIVEEKRRTLSTNKFIEWYSYYLRRDWLKQPE